MSRFLQYAMLWIKDLERLYCIINIFLFYMNQGIFHFCLLIPYYFPGSHHSSRCHSSRNRRSRIRPLLVRALLLLLRVRYYYCLYLTLHQMRELHMLLLAAALSFSFGNCFVQNCTMFLCIFQGWSCSRLPFVLFLVSSIFFLFHILYLCLLLLVFPCLFLFLCFVLFLFLRLSTITRTKNTSKTSYDTRRNRPKSYTKTNVERITK